MRATWGYCIWALSTVLSLLGVVLYIVVIIGIAAAMTWGVVKLFPPKTAREKAEAKSSGSAS
jgi:hypothetical protein